MDKTTQELCKEIRKLAGLKVTPKSYFIRSEIKAIASIINPSAANITDDYNKRTYCKTCDIFAHYVPQVWKPQKKIGTHPVRTNLINIYAKLSEIKATLSQPSLPFTDMEVEVGVGANAGVSNIKDIFNSLPEAFRNRAKSIEIKSNSLTISINLSD